MYIGLVIGIVIAVVLMYLFLKPSDDIDNPPRPSKKFGEGLLQDCDSSNLWGINVSDTWGPDKHDGLL